MIYEIRMTVTFEYSTGRVSQDDKFKTTLIEYIDAGGVDEAFNKAAKRKHKVVINLAKGEHRLWKDEGLGSRSKHISISLDAVVAKPELSLKQVHKKVSISSFLPDYKCERVECLLNIGTSLMLTKPVLETLLESLESPDETPNLIPYKVYNDAFNNMEGKKVKKRTYEYNWLVSLLAQARTWLDSDDKVNEKQALIRIDRVMEIIGEVQSGISLLIVRQD